MSDERAGNVVRAHQRRWRERSNHDVTTYGVGSTPCFCWATETHKVGQEQRSRPNIPTHPEATS